jgi:alpha-ketoglutarate-dependent taurine dioxygenase
MSVYQHEGQVLPYLVDGGAEGGEPVGFVEAHRTVLRDALAERGSLLLRGFPVAGVAGFEAVVRALSGEPLRYSERSSPRSTISGNVYTSTDYPPDEEIFLHNENSYQASWPRTLYFYCVRPPETLGATPLADIRQVYAAIDPSVRSEFERRKWMVVRNFRDRFGVSWRDVFGTEDRAEVRSYCAEHGITPEWTGDDQLRTTAVREPVRTHPVSGAPVWFNHATFFHYTTLSADVRDGLLELFGEDELPTNTYYGDGGRIPDDVVAHLRECYRDAAVRFDWRRDDILVVDNMAAAHGREPYTGDRKIAVAMAEPFEPAAG